MHFNNFVDPVAAPWHKVWWPSVINGTWMGHQVVDSRKMSFNQNFRWVTHCYTVCSPALRAIEDLCTVSWRVSSLGSGTPGTGDVAIILFVLQYSNLCLRGFRSDKVHLSQNAVTDVLMFAAVGFVAAACKMSSYERLLIQALLPWLRCVSDYVRPSGALGWWPRTFLYY